MIFRLVLALQVAVSIILPLILVKVLNPILLEAASPHGLGCCGPLSGFGILSGILMTLQLRLNLGLSAQRSLSETEKKSTLHDLEFVPIS